MRAVELQSGNRGHFEITLDGELLFSKKHAGRFPKPGEVARLFELKASVGSDFHAPGESWLDLGQAPPLPADVTPIWSEW